MTELTDERLRQIIAHAETVEKWQGPELLAIVRELLDLRSRTPTAAEAGVAVSPEVKALCEIHGMLLAARNDGVGFIDARRHAWDWAEAILNAATKLERLERHTVIVSPPIETEGREISEAEEVASLDWKAGFAAGYAAGTHNALRFRQPALASPPDTVKRGEP